MRKGRFAGLGISAPEASDRGAPALALVLGAPIAVGLAGLAGVPMVWTFAIALAAAAAAWCGLRLFAVARRSDAPRGAERASRLVASFEQSGCGWFWETDADGRLSYVSAALAAVLERPPEALVGRPFVELLLVEDSGDGDAQRPTLGFHLSSRFPFVDVMVAPNGRADLCWSLSGRPRFDEVGRFLGFQGVALNLDERRKAEIRSGRLAACDTLTGLPNRGHMRAMLDEALANAASRREGCALFLVDLDRFKQVNDTLGHPIGDLLLKEVALRLSAAIGEEGQVGRLGGDEFEALLPGIDEEGRLAALAERVIGKVSAPYVVRGHPISIGASVGIAISRPDRTLSDALIKEADLALYAAKKAGRGTYRFFEPNMDAEETERRILEIDLGQALARGQMRLAFQPIIDSASETLVGFEALLRWMHPTRGMLAPADFLPVAEASGLACTIGDWVVRAACAEAARWPDHLRLSVNLSAAEIEHGRVASTVAGALAASGLDGGRLELDLAEPVLLADCQEVRSVLEGLKSFGVGLALDDFGAGTTSLLSLQRAPLDRIKIHPRLLRAAMPDGGRAQGVLAAVVRLADSLGVGVTAEGIETADELALARKLGCGEIQGFLFARPMNAADALELAAASRPVSGGQGLRPRPPRHSLIRRGALHGPHGKIPVRLRNISAEGAMIESGRAVEPGAAVELDLAQGIYLSGEVRWYQEGRIGVRFAEAFDLQRLGKAKRPAAAALLKPDYLGSELAPDSPWAARSERLSVKDVRRK
jgi:diguanylate cyclase (GGDEF)-like protein